MKIHGANIFRTLYSGLSEQNAAQLLLRCAKLRLPESAWSLWKDVSYSGPRDSLRTFPVQGSHKECLAFLDHYAFTLFEKEPSLNKYRQWLLTRLVDHTALTCRDVQDSQDLVYNLPKDMPKIVSDLSLFARHIRGKDANICRLTTLDALARIVAPYRPPVTNEQTDQAKPNPADRQRNASGSRRSASPQAPL